MIGFTTLIPSVASFCLVHTRFAKRPSLYRVVGATEVLFRAEVEGLVEEVGVKIVVAVAVGELFKTCPPGSRAAGSGNRHGETAVALPDPQLARGQGMVSAWSP